MPGELAESVPALQLGLFTRRIGLPRHRSIFERNVLMKVIAVIKSTGRNPHTRGLATFRTRPVPPSSNALAASAGEWQTTGSCAWFGKNIASSNLSNGKFPSRKLLVFSKTSTTSSLSLNRYRHHGLECWLGNDLRERMKGVVSLWERLCSKPEASIGDAWRQMKEWVRACLHSRKRRTDGRCRRVA